MTETLIMVVSVAALVVIFTWLIVLRLSEPKPVPIAVQMKHRRDMVAVERHQDALLAELARRRGGRVTLHDAIWAAHEANRHVFLMRR